MQQTNFISTISIFSPHLSRNLDIKQQIATADRDTTAEYEAQENAMQSSNQSIQPHSAMAMAMPHSDTATNLSNEDKLLFLKKVLQSMDLSDLSVGERRELDLRMQRAGFTPNTGQPLC